MELLDAIRRRRMCRDFEATPLADGQLDALLDLARRVPSAGYSQGFELLVLEGHEQTARYWDLALPDAKRAGFPWPGLLRAPVLVIPLADADAYVRRYAEPDKAGAGLGTSADAWPVPYWHIDTGMVVMNLLLAVEDAGLGALFFGMFHERDAVLRALGVPPGLEPVGIVAIGHRSAVARLRGAEGSAATRPRRPIAEVVHRGRWEERAGRLT
jgi:nitroreductase